MSAIYTEKQYHGFYFEEWVKKSLLQNSYGGKWDVVPVKDRYSIKTCQWGKTICLGDALRQYCVDQDFKFIIGFWEYIQNRKKLVSVYNIDVSCEFWKSLWGNIPKEAIIDLDSYIKNIPNNIDEFYLNYYREQVQDLKNNIINLYGNSIFKLNPKIDTKSQRRLQTSISSNDFFKNFNLEKTKMNNFIDENGKEYILNKITIDK